MKRRNLLLLVAIALTAALVTPDLGARPGGGQSFKSPSRPSSPSTPSRPSSPSRPSTPSRPSSPSWPSSPSRPSSPSWPSSPSRPSSPSYPSGPSDPGGSSSPSDPSAGSSGGLSFFGFFAVLLGSALAVVLIVVLLSQRNSAARAAEWESGVIGGRSRRRRIETYGSLVDALGAIRRDDPEFSFVLFEDFLYTLYTEAHTARGAGRLEALAPYLSPRARGELGALGTARAVRSVVIGSIHVEKVSLPGDGIELVATFEANYEELDPSGEAQAYYAMERWTLTREKGLRSRPPERARVLDCPCCGAPLDKIVGGECLYCSKSVDAGERDWMVLSVDSVQREERPPMLTGTVEEVGTSDPTVVAPDVEDRWKELVSRDAALDWGAFSARVELIFRTFHEAWRAQDLASVRPYLSDNLFQTQTYWVDAYKRQRLRNCTDGARVVAVHLARIVADARFDAITVRVFATGLDYTVDEAGAVVAGSRSSERAYTEYWTLIRGSDRTGAPRVDPTCPSCGAPLDVNMAGKCQHCGAKVTAGEFDWVLSRIEQDEVYR